MRMQNYISSKNKVESEALILLLGSIYFIFFDFWLKTLNFWNRAVRILKKIIKKVWYLEVYKPYI